MKKVKIFSVLLLLLICFIGRAGDKIITPTLVHCFSEKNGQKLYLDYYAANDSSQQTYMGKQKPAIIFMFGGGFIRGQRNHEMYLPWFKKLTENGYKVFSIDYRLGLKGKKVKGIASINAVEYAINIGVEDLFQATNYIIANKNIFGIEPNNLIVSGSSAGAIIALQAEYYICNDANYTSMLPKDFNYAGLMSFSGAILSKKGKLKFKHNPCPSILFHGMEDSVVPYKQIKVLWLGFFGTDKIIERYKKFNIDYCAYRYKFHKHDIAEAMLYLMPEQLRFLETNVIRGIKRNCDCIIDDPEIPVIKGCGETLYTDKK